jgi:hypothetical protein
MVCNHLSSKFGTFVSSSELNGEMMPWNDWVFFESRRRCTTVVLILDSIVQARVTGHSPRRCDYDTAPAPSPRALWDAESEGDWARDYAGHLRANADQGMVQNRDLIGLREATSQHDRWYAYADSFGLLVTLVSNLIL